MSTGARYLSPKDLKNTAGGHVLVNCPSKTHTAAEHAHPIPVYKLMNEAANRVAREHGADILDQVCSLPSTPPLGSLPSPLSRPHCG